MSDPTTLIPNLNEIMEEYTEMENQAKQDSQAANMQVEDMDDENEKQQHTREESRKRNRVADEARAGNFISEKATALMERSLKDRGFIAERGFKKVISSFVEMLENRGWQSLGEHKEPGYASLVKEFFANMVEK